MQRHDDNHGKAAHCLDVDQLFFASDSDCGLCRCDSLRIGYIGNTHNFLIHGCNAFYFD